MSRARRCADGSALYVILVLCGSAAAFAQQPRVSLAIDPSRPLVEIILDHAGKRQPLSEFEPPSGLWLRLENNSRIPIRVLTFEPGTKDPGIGIVDEVIDARSSGLSSSNPGEVTHSRVSAGKGYSFDVGSPITIGPGRSVLFSVPLTHVGPSWFFRIRFDFDLPPVKAGRQPYAFVDFTWADVPPELRRLWIEKQVH
jgi:hypothetical protein